MENHELVYRVGVSDPPCTVTVRFGDRVASGMVIDVSIAGLEATLQGGETTYDSLPLLGEVGELAIAADWCRNPIVVAARAVRMAATDGDMCLFGFEFTSRPAELEPILHGLFNRRDAVRARPARNRPVEVTITSQTDVDVTGTLRDISSTGLGISAALTSERLLGPAKAVDVSLALGRDEEPLRVPATIRNRRCDERGADVIYGLVFAVPVSEPQLQTRIDDYVMQLQRQTLSPTSAP